jgi:hypothetical protein
VKEGLAKSGSAAFGAGCETDEGRTDIIPIKTRPKTMNPKMTPAIIPKLPVIRKMAAARIVASHDNL